jgi:hypothetical protein
VKGGPVSRCLAFLVFMWSGLDFMAALLVGAAFFEKGSGVVWRSDMPPPRTTTAEADAMAGWFAFPSGIP